MTRSYLIVPAGVVLLEVDASSPGAALRKAERGHAEPVGVALGMAVPRSRTTRRGNGEARPIPWQLNLDDEEDV